jgi:D-alanyl-D-alanine dipeptidase
VTRPLRRLAAIVLVMGLGATLHADDARKRDEPLVDLARLSPSIRIELRYATHRNLTQRPIYPENARCMLRASVAERLRRAQTALHRHGVGLKIWDAYRPAWAQRILWNAAAHPQFVGDPARGGSLHIWGVAVDVTLVDRLGRELKMPTGFDDFSPAAARRYSGTDPAIARNLRLLQAAMSDAGFLAMRDEWWLFVAGDYREFGPIDNASLTP